MSDIRIQQEDFNVDEELARLRAAFPDAGGSVAFIGTTRNISHDEAIAWIDFEHYAGMAEAELSKVRKQALERFDILAASMVHRVGHMPVGEQIVLVLAVARHRKAAFEACEYMIDTLKESVPIWKRERTDSGDVWVSATP